MLTFHAFSSGIQVRKSADPLCTVGWGLKGGEEGEVTGRLEEQVHGKAGCV